MAVKTKKSPSKGRSRPDSPPLLPAGDSPPPPEGVSEAPGLEDLSEEEERERLVLERKVERAFYEAGKALKELRDRRLYRSTHRTFEEYCRERFGFERRHPYRLIQAAEVVEHLMEMCPNGTQNHKVPQVSHLTSEGSNASETKSQGTFLLPTSERQVRPLTQLDPDEQLEAWQQAIEANQGKVPPARVVKDVAQRLRERRPVPNPFRVGDVCSILVKETPDLRGYGRCWAIVTELHEFSCTVQVWDGRRQVRLENLKELPYSPEQRQAVRELRDRLSKIQLDGLEKPVRGFLAELGKLDRPWLTSLEQKLLEEVEGVLRMK